MDASARIKKILSEYFKVPVESILETTTLGKDLDADSLDIIELSMALEDEFKVRIDDKELDKIKTVADVINLMKG
jgi:acyl carrier protein